MTLTVFKWLWLSLTIFDERRRTLTNFDDLCSRQNWRVNHSAKDLASESLGKKPGEWITRQKTRRVNHWRVNHSANNQASESLAGFTNILIILRTGFTNILIIIFTVVNGLWITLTKLCTSLWGRSTYYGGFLVRDRLLTFFIYFCLQYIESASDVVSRRDRLLQ